MKSSSLPYAPVSRSACRRDDGDRKTDHDVGDGAHPKPNAYQQQHPGIDERSALKNGKVLPRDNTAPVKPMNGGMADRRNPACPPPVARRLHLSRRREACSLCACCIPLKSKLQISLMWPTERQDETKHKNLHGKQYPIMLNL